MISERRVSSAILSIIICLFVVPCDLTGQIEGFSRIKWEREKVIPGLIRRSTHTYLYDTVPQNINILLVNLRRREAALQYDPERNLPVSRQAESSGAVAAVNGGFFNIRDGGSVTYIRTGGEIHDSDTANKWKRNANITGSILIGTGGRLFILKAQTNEWYDMRPEFPDVLITGPLLLENKQKTILPETSLVTRRHPRTAVGTLGKNRMLLITVDGRTGKAAGMTLHELSDLMISIKCRDAVNLDGGGSTTMWIKNKPCDGIVNMPCDNKKFDHEGSRAVSDIVIIK